MTAIEASWSIVFSGQCDLPLVDFGKLARCAKAMVFETEAKTFAAANALRRGVFIQDFGATFSSAQALRWFAPGTWASKQSMEQKVRAPRLRLQVETLQR
jgi:hypothetical protein